MRPIPGNQTREQNLSQSKSKTLFGRFNFLVTINRKQLANNFWQTITKQIWANNKNTFRSENMFFKNKKVLIVFKLSFVVFNVIFIDMELDSHTIFEHLFLFSVRLSSIITVWLGYLADEKIKNKNKILKKIINNSNNIQSREERNIREEVMFLEILI